MMGEVIRVSGRAPDVGDLLREAMLSQRFADVALCCSGGQRFLAHRLVLSAASPYLQDVLLAHGKSTSYSEPITIILAEVEGPELSAILGYVYTGSATIPKSRLEAFTRAAETLRVRIPPLGDQSTRNYEVLSLRHRNLEENDPNLDNVKIEETTNDTRHVRCEQYPSYDGWLDSASWHFHGGCAKRDYQRDDWIITSNDPLSRTIRRTSQDIGESYSRFHRTFVETKNDIPESEKIAFNNEKREILNFHNDKTKKYYFHEKRTLEGGPWRENNAVKIKLNSFVDTSATRRDNCFDNRNNAFQARVRSESRNFLNNDDESKNSFSTVDNSTLRTMSVESWRRYETRSGAKVLCDNDFEGSPETSESFASTLLLHPTSDRSSVNFEKQDYYDDSSAKNRPPSNVLTTESSVNKVISAASSTVTSDLATDPVANSTTTLRTKGDLCGESCCGWRRPRRHVANRVPASPWCQLARPAHHSPKIRPVILRNRDDGIETSSRPHWNESVISDERGTSSFSSTIYVDDHADNHADNSSPLPLNLRGNTCNDSAGSIYGYQVPETTDVTGTNDREIGYIERSATPHFYDATSYEKLSLYRTTTISTVEQLPSIISSNEIVPATEKFTSNDDPPRDQQPIRRIDEISNIIVNDEQSRVTGVSQDAISPKAIDKRIIIDDPSTCNLERTSRIELSHPISRLCDTARINDEIIAQDEFLNDKSTTTSLMRFPITGGIVHSDDNNNNELGIDDSVVENVRKIDLTWNEETERIAVEDGVGSNEEHRCERCGKTFVTRASLKVHGRTHSGEKPFRCNDCGKEFSQLRNYKYHRSVHEGTREFAATCPECGKYFNDRGYLSSHMKIHRNRKEYGCNECGKSFNQRVAYNMHVRIHTGVKPHRCDQCGKAFSRKMLLKQHLRTHSGERPYRCSICQKAFADRSNMTLHTRLHSGLKPYQCTLCTKAFTKKHHLKTHLNYHTGTKPYSCPNCSLRFSQSSNMRTHYKKCSTGINPLVQRQGASTNRDKDNDNGRTPSGVIRVLSGVVKAPSVGRSTNALTPPNSDQESSIRTPSAINDQTLRSTSRIITVCPGNVIDT